MGICVVVIRFYDMINPRGGLLENCHGSKCISDDRFVFELLQVSGLNQILVTISQGLGISV